MYALPDFYELTALNLNVTQRDSLTIRFVNELIQELARMTEQMVPEFDSHSDCDQSVNF